jgi:fructose-1,6-bisphosphatase/inositol monophosphatase family enzyme
MKTSLGKSWELGELNGPAVGIISKEMVRRAINAIRNLQQSFEVQTKMGYGGTMDDVLTNADKAAQELYLRTIQEVFPNAGVIAEEDSLSIKPKGGCKAYFTVDPLDGTKAFVRTQSHGVGSMLALVLNDEVISAYIGDVNTREIYGYRPGSTKVHRINEFNTSSLLPRIPEPKSLSEQYVALRDPERKYSKESQKLIQESFKNLISDGGSIGTWIARLWKREVGAAIIPPGWETPWDSTPIIGISKKLGYRFYRPVETGGWIEVEPKLPKKKFWRDYDLLVVHKDDIYSAGTYLDDDDSAYKK